MTDARPHIFDWPAAIARNRAALLRVVAVLVLYAGLDDGGAQDVPRRVWRRIVRLLRPAEAAARRLIVIAARGVEPGPVKPWTERQPTAREELQAAGLLVIHKNVNFGLARMWQPPPEVPPATTPRVPAFRLTDPPRRFDPKGWDGWRPFPETGFTQADPDEEVSAGALCRRIEALKRALDDLDGHARRFARRQARRAQMPRAARRSPLRPGLPPGHDKRAARAVDHVLAECHGLALQALRPPDTS